LGELTLKHSAVKHYLATKPSNFKTISVRLSTIKDIPCALH